MVGHDELELVGDDYGSDNYEEEEEEEEEGEGEGEGEEEEEEPDELYF